MSALALRKFNWCDERLTVRRTPRATFFECAQTWREALQLSNLIRLLHSTPVIPDINSAVSAIDKAIADAPAALSTSVAKGLIIGLLHGHHAGL